MNKNYYSIIGVMSGTSLDGIDFVFCQFDKNQYSNFTILASKTVPYTKNWKAILQTAISFSEGKLHRLNIEYGQFLGKKINEFIDEFSIKNIDFIASHGHTILHQPDKGVTLQIGDGQQIATLTSLKTVCDFRTQDVLFGGQGAPLVPIGDELLFSKFDYCLNLGGFANISFRNNKKNIAFDVSPVNIVLNRYAEKVGFPYDDGGKIAASGSIQHALLNELNNLAFYQQKPPKSLGLEWVQKEIFPILNTFKTFEKNILHTFVEHIAIQIAYQIQKKSTVLVTGGGVFNSFLLERMRFHSSAKFEIPSNEIVNYKEALIFAFLGLLRIENKVNCLQSVTGAKKDHCSGVVFLP